MILCIKILNFVINQFIISKHFLTSNQFLRHLQNPYDFGKPISESLDGVVIQQGIAEELIRIFKETERKD